MISSLRLRLLMAYLFALGFLSLNPWLRPDSHRVFDHDTFDLLITWDLVDHAIAYGLLAVLLKILWHRT